MSKRTTLMLDDVVYNQLRNIQSALIRTTHQNHSFSSVVNDLVKVGIRTKYRKGLK